MIEETHWQPVALVDDVDTRPLGVTLLGRAVVVWRDGTGLVHAWADQCPHRGSRLSLGRVNHGKLECAYHGWQFAPGGQCVQVPALPSFKPPASHCARTFEAMEKYGLIWVALSPERALKPPLPAFEAEFDGQLRKLNCGPYEVAASAPRIVENFLDMAHFAFVHEGSLGMRSDTAVDDYQVTATPNGLLATQCRAWQPQSNVHSTAPAQVEYTYEVTGPYSAVLTKLPDAQSVKLQKFRESIALFICPVAPASSRVWFRLAVADFESSDEKLREFQHRIFSQDRPVLESQTPACLPLDPRAELHTAADKSSAAYRRYLLKLGITFGVCQ